MTQEQKSRAYDEALNKIKPLYEQAKKDGNPIWSTYEYLIPQLAESEDERIRKGLIKLLTVASEAYLVESTGIKKDSYLAYLEKQKEQKPAESISQPTVQGKGVYKICPRCKERMVRDDSMVYTSMPPQYSYECPKCGEIECDTVMYDNPEMEKQKPAEFTPNQFDGITYGMSGYSTDKPAEWSEEDENVYKTIMDDFNGITPMSKAYKLKAAKWLKSILERCSLQPKQEWSDEDERIRKAILGFVNPDKGGTKYSSYAELVKWSDWLKSLRPSWKPSEEQMKALSDACCIAFEEERDFHPSLSRLYHDLRKL